MATHTLGPWIAGNLDGGPLAGREDEICVTTESGAVICTVWPMGEDFDLDESPERDANAILIASAPLLQKHVRILREAAEDARKELEAQAAYFGSRLDPDNNLFQILRKLESVLEATKEP